MSDDLDHLLRRTAAAPSQPLDVDRLLHRARRRRRRNRRLAALTAMILIVGAVLGALPELTSPSVVFDEPDTEPAVPAPAPTPAVEPDGGSPPPTTEPDDREPTVAPAPIEGRSGTVSVWTGEEVLVWGGLIEAPMGAHPDLVHSGEMHEDGADPVPIGELAFSDGGAYDPAGDAWRVIASAPFSGRHGDRAVWTGQEMLVWSAEQLRLAAYDPAADEWRDFPTRPDGGSSTVGSDGALVSPVRTAGPTLPEASARSVVSSNGWYSSSEAALTAKGFAPPSRACRSVVDSAPV